MKKDKIIYGNNEIEKSRNDKIELVNCQHNCINCTSSLMHINRLFQESAQFHIDKEYQFSIVSLKKAFELTYDLSDPLAQECAVFLRFQIIESLENTYQELKKMTKGFILGGRYKKSYTLAEETLENFQKAMPAGKERNLQNSSFSVVKSKIQPSAG